QKARFAYSRQNSSSQTMPANVSKPASKGLSVSNKKKNVAVKSGQTLLPKLRPGRKQKLKKRQPTKMQEMRGRQKQPWWNRPWRAKKAGNPGRTPILRTPPNRPDFHGVSSTVFTP